MAIRDVCRLCLTTDDLVWIFDKRFENTENMKDVIYITTGVEITSKDIISQKICKKCCQVTIKMFEFRRTSLKNDQRLREQCKMFLKDKEIKIPNTQVTIRSEGRKPNIPLNSEKKIDINKNGVEVRQETKSLYKIHPTVRELFKVYPQIKLPTACLKYNIVPCVSMKMDQVENYFKSRKLDFQQYTKLALNSGKVATKRTSAVKAKSGTSKAGSASKIIKNERKDPLKIKATASCSSKSNDKSLIRRVEDTIHKDMVYSDVSGDKSSIQEDLSKPKVNLELVRSSSNKRKLFEIEKPEKEYKKTNFIESLGLTPKVNATDSLGGALSYVANKSMPLHICEICNSVQYSAKDLRRHQNSHLRCQFCKTRFRSLEVKKQHLNNRCAIKNMMNNLPDIKLQRVELNEWVRSIYPEAFEDFPSIKNEVVDHRVNVSEVRPVNVNDSSVKKVDFKPITEQADLEEMVASKSTEIIEILSDDEEPSSSTVKGPPLGPLAQLTNFATSPIQTPQRVPVVNTAHLPLSDNIVYNTVSIVRPDIKIKGSCALDIIDARLTDIKVLKELLTIYRPVHLFADKNVQTELPANDSIIENRFDMSAEFRLLKPQLYVYKVPVIIKNGSFFDVNYNYTPEQKPQKKLCLWNDLTAIDIKPPSVKASPRIDNAKPQNTIILPSTATYNSTGVLSVVAQSTTPPTSKFIRVNASSLSPITTASFNSSPSGLIKTNPMPNNFLQSASSSVAPTTASFSTTEQTSNVETPVSSSAGQQLGVIRVKNVWELI